MNHLLPECNRRHILAELRESTELTFPKLCVPMWLESLQVLSVVAVPIAVILGIPIAGGFTDDPAFWCAPIAGLVAFVMLTTCLSYFWPRRRLPKDCLTVRGLTRRLLWLNFGRLGKKARGVREAEVWGALCEIIEEVLAVDRDELTEEADLYYDLGAG